jgi:ubiquinone/menaquinone biosynthesis C-methylase UbiE
MSGTSFTLLDLVDLALLHAAKSGRVHLENAEFQSFYETFFTDLDGTVMSSGADRRKAMRFQGVIDAVARHAPSSTLLDLGCGVGDALSALSTLPGLQLHGLDYARSTLVRAKGLVGDRATIVLGSATGLPYGDGHFGCVTCIEVLEHLPDDRGALREVHRVLAQGGIFVLTVPYRYWFASYEKLMGHLRHYDRASLERLLAEFGFETVGWIPNYPRWHRAANYAYVTSRLVGMIRGKLGGEGTPHLVRLPGMSRPLLTVLLDALEPLRKRDARLPYASLDTSTSLVARKIGPIAVRSERPPPS